MRVGFTGQRVDKRKVVRQLGQVLEDEVVEFGTLRQQPGRIEGVTPEPRAGSNPYAGQPIAF